MGIERTSPLLDKIVLVSTQIDNLQLKQELVYNYVIHKALKMSGAMSL